MIDRTHNYLDGDLPREELDPHEEQEAVALLGAISRVDAHLKGARPPDLASRIMDSLPEDLYGEQPRGSAGGPLGWLLRPRAISFTYRPAFALGALAAAVIAFALLPAPQLPPQPPTAAVPAVDLDAHLYVQFRLDAPEASDVRLAGSFTDWEPTVQLSETAPGVWSAMVPLGPGVHDYTFLVDGARWVVDPNATNVEDSFGGMNSRLFLAAPFESA